MYIKVKLKIKVYNLWLQLRNTLTVHIGSLLFNIMHNFKTNEAVITVNHVH